MVAGLDDAVNKVSAALSVSSSPVTQKAQQDSNSPEVSGKMQPALKDNKITETQNEKPVSENKDLSQKVVTEQTPVEEKVLFALKP